MLKRTITRALERLLTPVDIAWLVAFRVLFGLVMCVSALRFIAYGWIDDFFVTPTFHFKYYGFAWVEPLPGPELHALFWALAVLSACVALGLFEPPLRVRAGTPSPPGQRVEVGAGRLHFDARTRKRAGILTVVVRRRGRRCGARFFE